MRGHADRQRDGALGAARLGRLDRAPDGSRFARDHDLAGGVEIHRLHYRPARRLAAHGDDRLVIEAENGRHRPGSRRNGLLHHLTAKAHQLHRCRKIERPGASERGELSQAVAGDEPRQRAAPRAPGAPHGHPGGKHRGLRTLGGIQALFGPIADQLPQVIPQDPGRLVEGRPHHRVCGRQRPEHSDRLRSLAGEHERERHPHSLTKTARDYNDTGRGFRNAATVAPPSTP